ncbi:unnamed protein product [Adineta steineri]|uniref:Uncharacterized protein n=1 Tax=Adineta steineri TaxID=433720 RepID=A0A819C431_9BILA|nr:unnamed protein product [Adineta steineri]CAF3812452.1 unnamed protein product [Adineta steineri]
MFRVILLFLILSVTLPTSSISIIRKDRIRRQLDNQHCDAITGFDCKCSFYRVTCTIDHELPSPINIIENEKHKYQSVELIIEAPRDIHVNEYTFEPVKELYSLDGDHFEFRIKFEKFTALHLSSPSIFNRIFSDNLPSNARTHLALEIYNPEVTPDDNPNLFQNLHAESLELYALYPFHGTFQQLFKDANIKFLRLSGDIRSDVSETFTGNIARLELAKQANAISVQHFPVYPAHELTINAFYVTDFDSEHPPNYANLVELRVHTQNRIPAHAFRQFPNILTLSVQSDQGIDSQAFDGLTHLEKLEVGNSQPSLDLFNILPNLKEFKASIETLDENAQCKLIEKLATGKVAIQAQPYGQECTCVSAYLDTAVGRFPCSPQGCEYSSCVAIKNNYNADTSTFNPPPTIQRSDGTDALREREPRVYTAPYQVTPQDKEKFLNAAPVTQPEQPDEDRRRPDCEYRGPDTPYDPQDADDYSSSVDNNQTEKPYSYPWDDPNYYQTDVDNSQTEKPYSDPSPKYENPWDDPNYYQTNVDNSQNEKPYSYPWDDLNYYQSYNELEAPTQINTRDSWEQYPSDITTTAATPFYPINDDSQEGQDSEESRAQNEDTEYQTDSATAQSDERDAGNSEKEYSATATTE